MLQNYKPGYPTVRQLQRRLPEGQPIITIVNKVTLTQTVIKTSSEKTKGCHSGPQVYLHCVLVSVTMFVRPASLLIMVLRYDTPHAHEWCTTLR